MQSSFVVSLQHKAFVSVKSNQNGNSTKRSYITEPEAKIGSISGAAGSSPATAAFQ